jgi:hypothetical protein
MKKHRLATRFHDIEGTDIEGIEEVTTIPNSLGVCDECGYLVCPFNAGLVPQ